MKRIGRIAKWLGLGLLLAGLGYLLAWPVPVDPVAWEAPPDPGYAGPFAPNDRLAAAAPFVLPGASGPEGACVGPAGDVFVSVEGGAVLRLTDRGTRRFVHTGGRPLGVALDARQSLYIADAYRGLLKADREDGSLAVVAAEAEGGPLRYVDAVAVALDGGVWFTDASSKFGAEAYGGSFPASLLDLMEHGGHGRLLRLDPETGAVRVVLRGLNFANGVAVDPHGAFVLVVETGAYRVLKHHLTGPQAGQTEPLLGPLPCFPDNVNAGENGRFWLGCVSPRSRALDALAGWPRLRKLVQRLPAALRPKAQAYGHLIAFDASGRVLHDLQDPSGRLAFVTGAVESNGWLYITSLKQATLSRIRLAEALAAPPGAGP